MPSSALPASPISLLDGAIRARPVMLEAWSVCAGRSDLAGAVDRIERAGRLAAHIDEARRAFATPLDG